MVTAITVLVMIGFKPSVYFTIILHTVVQPPW